MGDYSMQKEWLRGSEWALEEVRAGGSVML